MTTTPFDQIYTLTDRREIPETASEGLLYEHRGTGARVLVLSNDDDNKVFSVGFRTPPVDSTGSPHIVEHCVLSGSEKYRTKEPFMDMLKGSLQTFLNAMTFPDKTVYPVASRNAKDFAHLMDVYLDAVFHPAIYRDERIFRQEGWHYVLPSATEPLSLSGVVYNEMRGAYSDPSSLLFQKMKGALYPDTAYVHESGGEPYTIPELTYDEFLAFHRRYYHPSNSYIFLYGDMDVEATLRTIHEGYLKDYTREAPDSAIAYQESFEAPVYAEDTYHLPEEAPVKDKLYLGWGVVAGESKDTRGSLRQEVLTEVLFNNESAPVKRALADAGLAEDVQGFSVDLQQPMAGVYLINAKDGSRDRFVEIVETTIEHELDKGLDKDTLLSTLNRLEYGRREADGYATRGIIYGIDAYDTWLYDGHPFDALSFAEDFEAVRREVEDGGLEAAARGIFLENPHKVILQLTPEPGLNDRKDREAAERLQSMKASMTPEAVEALVEGYRRFVAWQGAEETPEDLATIPKLTLEDVNPTLEVPERQTVTLETAGTAHLNHPYFTSGITYLELAFDYAAVPDEDLPYVSVLSQLLGRVSTADHDYAELDTATFLVSGGIGYSPRVLTMAGPGDTQRLSFHVHAKTLHPQFDAMIDLVDEILGTSRFDEEARIRELLQRQRSGLERGIVNGGNSYGIQRAQSYIRQDAALRERLGGIRYYQWLDDVLKRWDETWPTLRAKLEALPATIFTRDCLVSQLTADGSVLDGETARLDAWLGTLPETGQTAAERHFAADIKNEGIMTGSNVQYVCQVADYRPLGADYDGAMAVVATMLSRGYLHNQIRAQGGAYGAGLMLGNAGQMSTFSYRDPQITRTLEVYAKMADTLLEGEISDEALTTYIIGSMNRFDPPLTAQAKGSQDMARYLIGRKHETLQRWLDEALATDAPKIREIAKLLKEGFTEQKILTVIGGSARIREQASVFGEIFPLTKDEADAKEQAEDEA